MITVTIILGVYLLANPKTEREIKMDDKIVKTNEEWKKILTPDNTKLYERKKQRNLSVANMITFGKREYINICCVGCRAEIFKSDTKVDAGCGWNSFLTVGITKENVEIKKDYSHGMIRDEKCCVKSVERI